MKTSIIIPTAGRPALLEELLQSVQNSSESVEFHICINGRCESYSSLVKKWSTQPHIHFHSSSPMNVNIARNLGIAHSDAELYVFLDDDCRFIDFSEFLARIWNHNFDDCPVLGGQYSLLASSSALNKAYHVIAQAWIWEGEMTLQNNWHLLGGCLVLHRSLIASGYTFEEKIDFGSSETELLFRMFKHGVKMKFDHELRVFHNLQLKPDAFLSKARKQAVHAKNYGFAGPSPLAQEIRDRVLVENSETLKELKSIRQWVESFDEQYLQSIREIS